MENLRSRLDSGRIRRMEARDDAEMAEIVRTNLEQYHLNIPGTAYFDPGLDHLHEIYDAVPEKRAYFVIYDEDEACSRENNSANRDKDADDSGKKYAALKIAGGAGLAEFDPIENCAEVQKLYLRNGAKGKGLGRYLLETVELFAREAGYDRMYLETHSNLSEAVQLYRKLGWKQIERPDFVLHTTMDLFFIKEFREASDEWAPGEPGKRLFESGFHVTKGY